MSERAPVRAAKTPKVLDPDAKKSTATKIPLKSLCFSLRISLICVASCLKQLTNVVMLPLERFKIHSERM